MKLIKFGSVLVASVLLVACGGGGDNAGNSTEFTTSPAEFKWTGADAVKNGDTVVAPAQCPSAGNDVYVTIIGGQAPFRIRNPYPGLIQVDRTEVTGKDPRFKVTTLGAGCGEISITVLDYHSQVADVEITLEAGEE